MVPEGWQEHSVGELVYSQEIGTSERGADEPSTVPLLKMGNLLWGGLDLGKVEEVDQSKVQLNQYLKAGDVLFNTRNTPDLVGKTALWNGQIPLATYDNNIARLRFKKEIDPYFISAFMTHGLGKRRIRSRAAGSTSVAAIYWKDLARLKLQFPPLPEQRKIAEILSTWDQAIEKTESLLANARTQKRALMQNLLTGKRRFPEFEGQPWREVRLGDISRSWSGGTPSRKRPDYYGGSIPWIKSGEVNAARVTSTSEFITEEALASSSARMVQPEHILVAMYGATAGVVSISGISAAINQAILAVEPYPHVSTSYLHRVIEFSMDTTKRLTQGGQPNLNAAIIRSMKLFLPDEAEQLRIALVLDNAQSQISQLTQDITKLRTEKKALMQQLLTGKRRVVL